jgi:hypothetical protein
MLDEDNRIDYGSFPNTHAVAEHRRSYNRVAELVQGVPYRMRLRTHKLARKWRRQRDDIICTWSIGSWMFEIRIESKEPADFNPDIPTQMLASL